MEIVVGCLVSAILMDVDRQCHFDCLLFNDICLPVFAFSTPVLSCMY
jgi:hypothetical protein